jgi:hypothetical protein
LRLPDANWAANFPTAAQTILSYFSFGNQHNIDGIIAINSSLVEKLLAITGDIYLPDYQTNVSAATFSTLARADRDEFFPGSKQKQHFLSSFMNQLKLRLSELSPHQQQQVLELIKTSFLSKDILLYSTEPNLQQIFAEHHATGQLTYDGVPNYFYLLESNVGINKANKNISRQVAINVTDTQLEVTILFANHNPAQPPADSADQNLDYANYQRVIVPPSWQLSQLKVNQQPLATWDENTITTDAGEEFKQLGFFAGIPAAQTGQISFVLTLPTTNSFSLDKPRTAPQNTLPLVKQPGLPPTPYTITHRGQSQTIILDQDTQLHLPL